MAEKIDPTRSAIDTEAAVVRLWLQALSMTAIAAELGITVPAVKRVIHHKARAFRSAGTDWKAERAAAALATSDWAKGTLVERVEAAGHKFGIRDLENLIKWVDFEARLVGYLAPAKAVVRGVVDSMTTEEMIALAPQLGVEVPQSLLDRIGRPPADARDG